MLLKKVFLLLSRAGKEKFLVSWTESENGFPVCIFCSEKMQLFHKFPALTEFSTTFSVATFWLSFQDVAVGSDKVPGFWSIKVFEKATKFEI